MSREQIGAIPFIKVNGKIQLVLITSRSSGKWIFPKGHPESHLSRPELAALEAFEEAGVTGTVMKDESKMVAIRRRGKRVMLRLYPLKIKDVLTEWPEQGQRERIFVSPRKAAALLGDRRVGDLMSRMAKAL